MNMKRIGWLALGVSFAFGSCICVERPRRMTDDERARLRQNVLQEPPARMDQRVGADLDGRLELLGYDLKAERDERNRIIPGRKIVVTWYWRCKEPLEEGWKLFTHVADDTGTNRVPADSIGLVRTHYQPSLWQKGEVIVDRQEITIPADFNSRTLTLYTGAWFGPNRLPVRNDAPNDGSGRVRAGPFDMQYDLPTAAVPMIDPAATIVVDGRLDEPAWAAAAELGPFVPAPDGSPVPEVVRAKVMWSRRFLYVAFEVRDRLLVSQFSKRDDEIYKQDAVEIFLDEGGDGKDYYEFEVSPTGVLFDLALSEPRKGEPGAFTASEFRAGVTTDGTPNDATPDRGYVVELQIPFAALSKFRDRPPTVGGTLRANFYVLDMVALPSGPDDSPGQDGYAWSAPRTRDFHEFRRFGELRFEGPARATPAASTSPPPPLDLPAGTSAPPPLEPPAPPPTSPTGP